MVNVAQVDRRTGRDWPYTEKQMQRQAAIREDAAQRDYPTSGRTTARRASA
jgi:hypothetical protein